MIRIVVSACCCLVAAFAARAVSDPPATSQPAAPAEVLSIPQRVEVLRAVLGPNVDVTVPATGGTLAPVRAVFHFDSPDQLHAFAVMNNRWEVADGVLHGSGLGVSQIVCLLPLAGESCLVRARARSSDILEIALMDPWARRFDGTRAVGRLHFGRMDHWSHTDWIELSSKRRSLQKIYDFRFPDAMQDARLTLVGGRLSSRLTVDGGVKTAGGQVPEAHLRPVVYVSLAGVVNSRVQFDELEIRGAIDLAADHTVVLTGMGPRFWGAGREVILYYRARGHLRRLLHNGEVVFEQPPIEGIWWPYEGPVLVSTVRLGHGDVLAFDLGGVDDEGALHVVGVDRATGRIVLGSHPLTFTAAAAEPEDHWYHSYPSEAVGRSNISKAQDESMVRRLREVLGRDFPGLPVIGPVVGQERRVFLKTQVR